MGRSLRTMKPWCGSHIAIPWLAVLVAACGFPDVQFDSPDAATPGADGAQQDAIGPAADPLPVGASGDAGSNLGSSGGSGSRGAGDASAGPWMPDGAGGD